MDKNTIAREAVKNLAQKKCLFVVIIFLVILSGFLLFNHISYLNGVYTDKPTNGIDHDDVR